MVNKRQSRSPYQFIRFNPLHKEAAFMMPQLILRIRRFIKEVTPEINPDDFIEYILYQTQEYPEAIRIWIALNQNNAIVGHMIVTSDVYLKEVYLHIQQLMMDDLRATRHLKAKVLKSMLKWVRQLNEGIEQTSHHQIHRLYLTTGIKRNMKAWERMLPGFRLIEERKLGIFELPHDVIVKSTKQKKELTEV